MKNKLILFWTFFKIGIFTFGGGFAMIPLIEKEIVDKKKWISRDEMVDILVISQSFPGAVAVNSAIFIGKKIAGYPGAFLALLGVIVPSFSIIIVIAKIFSYFSASGVIQAALAGISSTVIALLVMASIRVSKAGPRDKISPLLTLLALVLLLFTGLHPIYVIVLGIAAGLLIYLIRNISKKTR